MMKNSILDVLKNLEITFEYYEHPSFDTCEVSSEFHVSQGFPGQRAKNLFLRNKNGKQHFLVMLPHHKDFDKTYFREISGQKCGLASDDRLDKYLKVKPGHVSPLALINDTEREVQVYLDEELMNSSYIHIHPGENTSSVQLMPEDLLKFLNHLGYEPAVHNFS